MAKGRFLLIFTKTLSVIYSYLINFLHAVGYTGARRFTSLGRDGFVVRRLPFVRPLHLIFLIGGDYLLTDRNLILDERVPRVLHLLGR